jgi:hypothetical protein
LADRFRKGSCSLTLTDERASHGLGVSGQNRPSRLTVSQSQVQYGQLQQKQDRHSQDHCPGNRQHQHGQTQEPPDHDRPTRASGARITAVRADNARARASGTTKTSVRARHATRKVTGASPVRINAHDDRTAKPGFGWQTNPKGPRRVFTSLTCGAGIGSPALAPGHALVSDAPLPELAVP